MNNASIEKNIDWQKVDGLVPAIIQHFADNRVLMLGYMNKQALTHTLNTEKVTFYSRTRKTLWTKGETSGHFLQLDTIELDCDNDTLLIRAQPIGPVCHRLTETCFEQHYPRNTAFIAYLKSIIEQRDAQQDKNSYTVKLLQKGTARIAQKVGEEGVETAIAGALKNKSEVINESADLIYHLLVLLHDLDIDIDEVMQCLKQRHVETS